MWPPRSQPRIKSAVCCERLTREQAATAPASTQEAAHGVQNGRNRARDRSGDADRASAGVGRREDNYTHHRLPFSSQPFPLWHAAVPVGRPTAVGPGQSRRGPTAPADLTETNRRLSQYPAPAKKTPVTCSINRGL